MPRFGQLCTNGRNIERTTICANNLKKGWLFYVFGPEGFPATSSQKLVAQYPDSVVVTVRGFPTGRVQSYAKRMICPYNLQNCTSTPAPTHFQIRSAFAPSTHDKSN